MKSHELTVEGVRFSYGPLKILSDVYLSCRTGDIVGLFGRNGSGKSTLLQIIFGTLDSPDKIIRINNKVYAQPYLVKGLISYLPQFTFLPANISLKRIIMMYVNSIRHRNSLLEDSAVKPHLQKTTAELSGGELRYFEILLVLSSKAKFILLDEPFMGIEPIYQEKIKELIISNRGVKGFIITDHTYSAVMSISNHKLLISKGRVDRVSTEEELKEKGYLPPRQAAVVHSNQEIPAIPTNSEFEIDKQTFKDLGLFEDNRNGAFFKLFSSVKTIGGNTVLMNMLLSPTYDISFLENRRDSIQFFIKHKVEMRLNKVHMEMIDYYLSSTAPRLRDDIFHTIQGWLRSNDKQRNDEHIIKSGVSFLLSLLKQLSQVAELLSGKDAPDYLLAVSSRIEEFISESRIAEFINCKVDPTPADFVKLDKVFRNDKQEKLKTILGIVYEIEVFECLSALVDNFHFSLPEYSGAKEGGVQLAGLFHPLIKNPVANDFTIGETKNVCLLTGANMAGKSTFLKSFSICMYLAHIGFPVPAQYMKTRAFKGIITTINLSDNISEGHSHFLAEVKRIKQSALLIKDRKDIIVVFDELFRGTNVKEAYEASLMITSAFSEIDSSLFLISTHITEICNELKKQENIFFNCFESELQQDVPVYSYQMKSGISEERMGMPILRNENILEILKQAKSGK